MVQQSTSIKWLRVIFFHFLHVYMYINRYKCTYSQQDKNAFLFVQKASLYLYNNLSQAIHLINHICFSYTPYTGNLNAFSANVVGFVGAIEGYNIVNGWQSPKEVFNYICVYVLYTYVCIYV
jgi:hypothetical protein